MQASTLKLLFATSLIMGVLASTMVYVYVRDTTPIPQTPRLQRDRQQPHSVTNNVKSVKPLKAPTAKP